MSVSMTIDYRLRSYYFIFFAFSLNYIIPFLYVTLLFNCKVITRLRSRLIGTYKTYIRINQGENSRLIADNNIYVTIICI